MNLSGPGEGTSKLAYVSWRGMSIHVALHHRTTYRYDRPVNLGPQSVRLRPAPHCRSRILELLARGEAEPALPQLAAGPAVELRRAPRLPRADDRAVDRGRPRRRDGGAEPVRLLPRAARREMAVRVRGAPRDELAPYRRNASRHAAARRAFVASISREPRATNDFLVDLNRRVFEHIEYGVRLEAGLQTPEETLEKRAGSCRDSGWLLVQILRRLGFAARFASGLPHPAHRRREAARRRRRGPDVRLRRSACVVRGLPAGRGLDSGSTRRPGCSPARGTSRSRAPPSPRSRRR